MVVLSKRGAVVEFELGARRVRLVLALGFARPGLWAWRSGAWRFSGLRLGIAGAGVAVFDGGAQ